jgi:hypothetical protein
MEKFKIIGISNVAGYATVLNIFKIDVIDRMKECVLVIHFTSPSEQYRCTKFSSTLESGSFQLNKR